MYHDIWLQSWIKIIKNWHKCTENKIPKGKSWKKLGLNSKLTCSTGTNVGGVLCSDNSGDIWQTYVKYGYGFHCWWDEECNGGQTRPYDPFGVHNMVTMRHFAHILTLKENIIFFDSDICHKWRTFRNFLNFKQLMIWTNQLVKENFYRVDISRGIHII